MTAAPPVVNWNDPDQGSGNPDWNQGPPGPTGPAGPIGPPGPPGNNGQEGIAGPMGPAGTTGSVGPVGPAGPTGPQGLTGPGGVQGPQGNPGNPGPAGAAGAGLTAKGTVATIGALPPSGNQNGDTYTVAANNHMYTWQNGSWVDMGAVPAGATGPQGPPGAAGTPGAAGATGPQGPTGATGAQGPTGAQGTAGSNGAQGPAGPGVAAGGATGTLLQKNSATNYDTAWVATIGAAQIAAGAAASNVGTLGGVLGGTLPNPTMAAGAAATNVGTLGGSLSGTLPNPTLAANSVGASQITDGTVGAAELATNAVTTVKIADANVTNAKLASDTARDNLLTNGGFEIWQRGNGPFTANGVNTADRWVMSKGAGAGTITVSQETITVAPRSTKSLKYVYVLGAGDTFASLYQGNFLTETAVKGVQFSLSIQVNSSVIGHIRAFWQDGVTGGAAARQYSAYNTTASAWETLTVTGTPSASSTSFYVGIEIDAGFNQTVYIDDAMLVVGSVPADYAPLHPADDLARCLRYYEVVAEDLNLSNYGAAISAPAQWYLNYKVRKPVAATLTKVGTWTVPNCAQPTVVGVPSISGFNLATVVTAVGNYQLVSSGVGFITAEANP